MSKLLLHTYIPVLIVMAITVAAPFIINNTMEDGVLRFFINISAIELSIFIFGWFIAFSNEERLKILSIISRRISRVC